MTTTETEPDYYALLGVSPNAAPEEIRRAYGARAQGAMQDRETFEQLSAAWEVLKDTARRAAYDRRRVAAPPPPAAPRNAPTATIVTKGESTRMGTSDATVAMPPSGATMTGQTLLAPGAVGGYGGERTQAVNLPPCPICGTPGVPGEEFCVECGFLAGSAPGAEVEARPLPKLVEVGTGREWTLKAGENTVGREGADIMLPDKTVSRRHARILVEPSGSVLLEDLGSTNGTKRAGTPLPGGQRTTLADGMAVQFGSIKLTAVIPAGSVEELLSLPAPEASGEQEPLLALSAPSETNASQARLIGKDGKAHVLAATRTTFGRRPDNDVVLTGDSFVSGAHASIVYEGDTFKLVDLGSTNGTKLNGQRIIPNIALPLKDGDDVMLGQTGFTFRGPAGRGG